MQSYLLTKHMKVITDGSECLGLCIKILEMLERDSQELSLHLQGDVIDAYQDMIKAEVDGLDDVQTLLRRAIDQIEQ